MKMKSSMKKVFCVLLSLLVIVSAAPVAVAADTLACGHSEFDTTIEAKEPECENYGYTAQRECKICTYIEKAIYIPATGHNYKKVEGSQNEEGILYRCDGCMDSYVKGHTNWSYSMMAKAPTCTQDGWTADAICGECGYHQVSEKLYATGHEYEVVSSDSASHTIRCKKCGDSFVNDGHTFVIQYDGDFNCYSENATGKKVCSKCGYVAQSGIAVEKDNHPNMIVSTNTEYTLRSCEDCGYARITANRCGNKACNNRLTSGEYSIRQPGCDTAGYIMYKCNECSHTDTVSVAAMGHYQPGDYEIVVQPLCSRFGKKVKPCLRCDYVEEVVIPKAAHLCTPLGESYPATCTEDGLVAATFCVGCGSYFAEAVLPSFGHNLIDYNGEQFCTNCYMYMIDTDNETVACKCLCHNHDGLAQTVFKFIMFFCKLFGIMQTCDCGTVHYEKAVK